MLSLHAGCTEEGEERADGVDDSGGKRWGTKSDEGSDDTADDVGADAKQSGCRTGMLTSKRHSDGRGAGKAEATAEDLQECECLVEPDAAIAEQHYDDTKTEKYKGQAGHKGAALGCAETHGECRGNAYCRSVDSKKDTVGGGRKAVVPLYDEGRGGQIAKEDAMEASILKDAPDIGTVAKQSRDDGP